MGVLVDEVKVMRSNRLRTWWLIAVLAGTASPNITSAEPQPDAPVVVHRTSAKLLRDVEPTSAVASPSSSVSAIELPQPLNASDILQLNTSGGVASPPVGSTRVYGNEIITPPSAYVPGANQRIADDLHLANGACNAVYYNLKVYWYGITGVGASYNVHTELWMGDPCSAGSTAIAGTGTDLVVLVPSTTQRASVLEFTLNAPTPVPATVWLAVTFSSSDASWIIAEQAEIGSTQNFFSEDDDANSCQTNLNCTGGHTCQGGICQLCTLFNFTNGTPWAGFWANVYCETAIPPNGACCNGTTCTQTTQANCLSPDVWQGAFTTCQPNACLTGACCTAVDFETCADTNEPGCPAGLFRPGATCADNACGLNFEAYENVFRTGIFDTIDANTKWGDDLTLGVPCQLVAYEVLMAGDGTPPAPATFNTHIELWTNNDRGTPTVDADDIPLAVIPGTQRDFNGLAANLSVQRLLGGPFTSLLLPSKVWMVLTTNSNKAGPLFGGLADIGFSQDGFRIYNDPTAPNAWSSTLFDFGGYNPTNCPFDPLNPTCVPAGSFRAIVWCAGAPPTGACCNDNNGTCTDGVLATACDGRWMEGVTCASNPFNPPCGVHACCYPNPINPNSIQCQDLTPADCTSNGGSSAPGLFCVNVPVCPQPACINRGGDCFGQHGATGCENAFCCDKVCAVDPFCCTLVWDSACVAEARTRCSSDQCGDALTISGTGTFPFDNTMATTDGPVHAACADRIGDEEQIQKDVWYCWTASCTDMVYVRTCGQTTVDTKLAVYEGCTCPPTDAALLDCSDDRCGLQSTAVFHAVAGRSYLIRLGNYPGRAPGTGSLTISCGPPNQPSCPATGDCCAIIGTPGCVNKACCESVCGCDSYCCDTEWDVGCATTGNRGSGCGADVLCPVLCGNCPVGAVTFNSPLPGILDASRPFPPSDATQLLGIDTIQVTAPAGADLVGCWTLCDTASPATANGVASVTDNGGGQYTIKLARPITAGAVTKITYAGTSTFARYIAHPANMNVDGFANATDVIALVNALNGTAPLPIGLLSGDVDRSGAVTPADLLDLVGLLNGEGDYTIWNNTPKPAPNANCP